MSAKRKNTFSISILDALPYYIDSFNIIECVQTVDLRLVIKILNIINEINLVVKLYSLQKLRKLSIELQKSNYKHGLKKQLIKYHNKLRRTELGCLNQLRISRPAKCDTIWLRAH